METQIDDDDPEMTEEEFNDQSAEWKARGPFKVVQTIHRWADFLGKPRSKQEFLVCDAEGKKVGGTSDHPQALRWARELTDNGFIED